MVLDGEDDLEEPGRPLRGLMLDKQRVSGLLVTVSLVAYALHLPSLCQLSSCRLARWVHCCIAGILHSTISLRTALSVCYPFRHGQLLSMMRLSCLVLGLGLVKVVRSVSQSRVASRVC